MGIEFLRLNEGECLLCGASGSLTGEHKIKASLLKKEFGNSRAILAGKEAPRVLQSPRSKRIHFNSKICKDCNSSRSQVGDNAFDQLHAGLKRLRTAGTELTDNNHHPNCQLLRDVEMDAFRYFAKILCCFLAEIGGPRSRSLSAFALGISNQNPVFLKISPDDEYDAILAGFETQGFAQHGGLKFGFDDQKRWVQSFISSLSIGGIRYDFWVQLGWLQKLELHFGYSDLVRNALANLEKNEKISLP